MSDAGEAPGPSGGAPHVPGDPPTGTGGDPDARLARRPVHHGRIVNLTLDTVRFPDGTVGELEMVRHAGAAAVLPVVGSPSAPDPEVLLLHQYRYAAGGRLYEIPAGLRTDPAESWEACAHRELEEETGWRAGRMTYLGRIYTTPGFTDELIRLYLATELVPGASKLDEDEFVEVVRVPFSTVVSWMGEGRIVDAKSLATLLWAAVFVFRDSERFFREQG